MKVRLTKQSKILAIALAVACVVALVSTASVNYAENAPQKPSFSLNEHDAILQILETSSSSKEVLRRNQYVSYIGK